MEDARAPRRTSWSVCLTVRNVVSRFLGAQEIVSSLLCLCAFARAPPVELSLVAVATPAKSLTFGKG